MIQNSTNFRLIRRAAFYRLSLFVFAFGFSASALGILAGCTFSEKSASPVAVEDSRAKIGAESTIVMALTSGPATLDPRLAGDAIGIRLMNLMFTGLLRVNNNLELVGDGAESWDLKDNEYKFQLKSGLTFANGRPLTTDDLQFSFNSFFKSGTGKDATFAAVDRFETCYDETGHWVTIHFKAYSASLVRDLTRIKFLPHAETLAAGQDFAQNPIGSGPYVFASQNHSTIVLQARTDHPYIHPANQRLVFKIVHDDNTRLLKLLKGDIDIAQQELAPVKLKLIEKNPDFSIVSRPGLSVSYLIFNLRDPVFQNLDLRRALDKAIDRDSIVRYKQLGMASPASSFLAPANRYHNPELQPTAFDPEGAAEILKSIKGLSGHEIILKSGNNPASVENARVIANQWNKVLEKFNIHVRTQSYEWGTYYGDVQRGNFQVALMRWTSVIDPNIYRTSFYSTELPPDGKNRGYYRNLELDRLSDRGLVTTQEKSRKEIYDRVQKIVSLELPVLPLWYENEIAVFNKRVKGYEPSIYGDFYSLTKVSK